MLPLTDPSMLTSAIPLVASSRLNSTSTSSGNTNGRKLRLRAQIGVKRMQGTEGWTIDPPAEREYAVLPVGVLRRMPSETEVVKDCDGRNLGELGLWGKIRILICVKCGAEPRCTRTSFKACVTRASCRRSSFPNSLDWYRRSGGSATRRRRRICTFANFGPSALPSSSPEW